MDAESWPKLKEILNHALQLPVDQREAYVEKVCTEQPDVRRDVQAMLRSHHLAENFLETPAINTLGDVLDSSVRQPWIGLTVGSYHVVEEIGHGGMGVIYRAEDVRLGRNAALKFLPREIAEDPEARLRFEREARAASSLNHPNICTIYGIDEYCGHPFIAMEFLKGRTLKELTSQGALPAERLLDLGVQIADALRAAHAEGIVHRDIKPSNIFVTDSSQAKLLDFGLAKRNLLPRPMNTVLELGEAATVAESLTTPGVAMGTISYMSPEQSRGEELDARTDLFSFGAVLYEMATGQMAFSGNTDAVIYEAILRRPPTPPTRLNADVSPELECIITKALEKDRQLRYQNAADIHAALQRLKRDTESTRLPAASVGATDRLVVHWKVTVPAVLTVVVLAVGLYFYTHPTHKLTEKDNVVLADFANTTGDPVFDGALRQGLSSQLEQSPFLNLLSDERIGQTLSLMAKPKDTRLNRELAREVCQRTASTAVLDGSIAQVGIQYLLTLKALNCSNGESLASTEAQASDKNHVLDALGKVASEIRNKLGESLASVQKYDAPAENITTPSLEALKAYSLGYQEMPKADYAAAIPLFQRAVSLDPNFAMAYAFLGTCYNNLNESRRAAENTRKAYELKERVSEREKFYIASHYEDFVTGNLEAARKTYELWAQIYPRDDIPSGNLGNIYATLGNYDKALSAFQESVKLNPGRAVPYANLLGTYLSLNRLDEANAVAREIKARNLDVPIVHLPLYMADFLQHDVLGMEREVAGLMGKPGYEDLIFYYESETAAYDGHFAKARELTRRAADSAQHADEEETAAGYEAEAAVREALVGNLGLAKQQAQAALAHSNGIDVEGPSAIALALSGDSLQTQRVANDLGKRFPENSVVQFNYLPTIRAATALQAHTTGTAIDALTKGVPYELGGPARTVNFLLYPIYIRGCAFLAEHRGTAAAAEFQKILDHPGLVLNEPIGSLVHLQLGRAYAMQGDSTKAKAAYQDFLVLWKDADLDIPILKQAKAEYAKLQQGK